MFTQTLGYGNLTDVMSKNNRLELELEVHADWSGNLRLFSAGRQRSSRGTTIPGNTEFTVRITRGEKGDPMIYLYSPGVRSGALIECPKLEMWDFLEAIADRSVEKGEVAGKFYVAWTKEHFPVLIPTDTREGRYLCQEFVYRSYIKGAGKEIWSPGPGIPGNRYHNGDRAMVYIGKAMGADKKPTYAYIYESDIPEGVTSLSQVLRHVNGSIVHPKGFCEESCWGTSKNDIWIRFSRASSKRLVDLGPGLTPDLGPDWPTELVSNVLEYELSKDQTVSWKRYQDTIGTAALVLGGSQYNGRCKGPLVEGIIEGVYWNSLNSLPVPRPLPFQGTRMDLRHHVMSILGPHLMRSAVNRKPGLRRFDLEEILTEDFLELSVNEICEKIMERIGETDLSSPAIRTEIIRESLKKGYYGYLGFRILKVRVPIRPTDDDEEEGEGLTRNLAVSIVTRLLTEAQSDPGTWIPRLMEVTREGSGLLVDSLKICEWYPELQDEVWERRLLGVSIVSDDLEALLETEV